MLECLPNLLLMSIDSTKERVAKNVMMLYMRLFLTMCISIYTSRVLLNSLGVIDYGIYNVIGGLVGMLSFLNGSLTSSSQRFLTYSIGKGDSNEVSIIFTNIIYIHILLALIVVILSETVGIWLLDGKLNIPVNRMPSTYVAFHLSVLLMAINIVTVPYNALIIANERMSFFAYLSIYEVTTKLIIAFLITYIDSDKLIVYSILMTITQSSIWLIYKMCRRKYFPNIRFLKSFSKDKIKQLLSFISWNMFASIAIMLMSQGTNLILNVFFGPVINAARALAQQVQSALTQLYINFQMAINPQITKSYAQNNLKQMHLFMFASVKVAFVIMSAIALPFLFVCDYVLGIWLDIIPEYTSTFIKIGLLINVIDAISNPFIIGCMATGQIKKIMMICGTMFCMVMPISYMLFTFGFPPYYAYISQFSITVIAFFIRLLIVNKLLYFGVLKFSKSIIVPMVVVTSLSFSILYLINQLFKNDDFIKLVVLGLLSVFSVLSLSFIFLFNQNERRFVVEMVTKKMNGLYVKKNLE